ncbi:hypothetical protein Tco_1413076, partial [Tanacetum coccineum]
MNESIFVSSIIDKLPPSKKDFKHILKHGKDDLSLVQLGSHLRIEESLRGVGVVYFTGCAFTFPVRVLGLCGNGLWVSGGRFGYGGRVLAIGYVERKTVTRAKVDAITWWIDFGATTHVCKDRCWFKTYEPVEDGSVLYMGDDHFALVHGKGSVVLEFSSGKSITLFNVLYVPKLQFGYYNNGMFMLNLNKVPDDSDSIYMSYSAVVNSSLWHARLGHVHYKRMLEMS